jgi:hypothetical protein
MFVGDAIQELISRRVVQAHGRSWLLCHQLGEDFYLAVPCSDAGEIALPSEPAVIIRAPDVFGRVAPKETP